MSELIPKDNVREFLDRYTRSRVPGLQYLVVAADSPEGTLRERICYEYTGGWADLQARQPMTLDTTMMAYSMTKTFTAIAVLQLLERGELDLADTIDRYLPHHPFNHHHITIRELLAHTSGLPNPIPLRWVHLTTEDESFDENAALDRVLRENSQLAFKPGEKFGYSNIGYWLLGKIIEDITGESYSNYVRSNILLPLGLKSAEMDFAISNFSRHAKGYLAKYSITNLVKGFITDRQFWGEYEGNWLHLNSHYLNGAAFGGLVGTARGFSCFLQDQLQPESVLFNAQTKQLLSTQQTTRSSKPIPMTLGWHIGRLDGIVYLFKEGGGGGFHCEMRLYLDRCIASVVMANDTEMNSTKFLNFVDAYFLSI